MSDDLPSGKRIFELTRRAIHLEKLAHQWCSLSYELFVADPREEADLEMRKMNPASLKRCLAKIT